VTTPLQNTRAFFSSLRVRLLALVLLAVVPALGLVLYSAWEQRQQTAKEVTDQALRLARLASIDQERLIDNARHFLAGLARLPKMQERDEAWCSEFFSRLLGQHLQYANLGVIDATGTLYCSGLPSPPIYAGDRTYFRRAIETRDFAIGDYQIGRITKKPTINFGYPVMGASGQVGAVVFAALDLAWLNRLGTEAQLPDGTSLTVIDRRGTVIVRYPDQDRWVGKMASETPIVKTILAQREGVSDVPGLDGVPRLYGFTSLGGTSGGAYISIGVPKQTAFAAANDGLIRTLAWFGFVASLVLASAWFGADLFVLRQVKTLIQAAQRLASGDLSARSGLATGGELGELASVFDRMAESLEAQRATIARDITERQQAEDALIRQSQELARSNAELEQFASVASHDLQEPLRMVASYTQLLAKRYKGKLDADAEEFIRYAVDGATRMQRLIQDLLTFSRAGSRRIEPAPTDCEAVLDQALMSLKTAVEETGALITRDPLPTIKADALQLVQLFQNIIGNAIRYRTDDRPRIHTSADLENHEWVFSVHDNGIGIDPKYADRIFEVFERLHSEAEYPGTGIGLAICKKIVDRHEGRIWVESELGKGATFFFTIPAQ